MTKLIFGLLTSVLAVTSANSFADDPDKNPSLKKQPSPKIMTLPYDPQKADEARREAAAGLPHVRADELDLGRQFLTEHGKELLDEHPKACRNLQSRFGLHPRVRGLSAALAHQGSRTSSLVALLLLRELHQALQAPVGLHLLGLAAS